MAARVLNSPGRPKAAGMRHGCLLTVIGFRFFKTTFIFQFCTVGLNLLRIISKLIENFTNAVAMIGTHDMLKI